VDLLYGWVDVAGRGRCPTRAARIPDRDHPRVEADVVLAQRRTSRAACHEQRVRAESDCVVAMVGEITNFDDLAAGYAQPPATDLELLARLFVDRGFSFADDLEGIYSIAIYDRRRQVLRILQDRYTSPWTLYWTVRQGWLYFGTSLKRLLLHSEIHRTVDGEAFADFMVYGFVPRRRTLLQGIEKLTPGTFLEVRPGHPSPVSVGQRPVGVAPAPRLPKSRAGLAERYRAVMGESLRRLLAPIEGDTLHHILTSGYDSSLSLYLARGLHDGPIDAYCVGTASPDIQVGESERARTIAATYEGVRFHEVLLPQDGIRDLPDIAWRIEGVCWERGLLLRNRLSRFVADRGRHVVGGDVSNQVLNPWFHPPSRRTPRRFVQRLRDEARARLTHGARFWNRHWRRAPRMWDFHPRQLGLFMNIKQNGQLMASRSVQLKYPFLDRGFVALAAALARDHAGSPIDRYRSIVETIVPPAVAEVLRRPRRDTVREIYFFHDPTIRRAAVARIRASELIAEMVDRRPLATLVHRFLGTDNDRLASVVCRLLFVDLWHELFVSGDHDAAFEDDQPGELRRPFLG